MPHADQLPPTPQTDRAVQLLLETSAENPHYYCDSLKACLVTTVTSSGPSQSTIKLVATNMIASGKLAGNHIVPTHDTGQLSCTSKWVPVSILPALAFVLGNWGVLHSAHSDQYWVLGLLKLSCLLACLWVFSL